jgi:hypothetical protein
MYAERELKRLGEVKTGLRRRITRRRTETIGQVARVTQPLQWIDRVRGYWQQAGPLTKLASGPIGAWLLGKLFRRRKMVGSLMHWIPTLWGIVRNFGRAGAPRSAA